MGNYMRALTFVCFPLGTSGGLNEDTKAGV